MTPSNLPRTLNRVILGLAFLGILVVVHLAIQQGRGFDRGCLGFSVPSAVEQTFDCAAVVQTGAGSFLGMSNTVWGILFYALVVGLSAAVLTAARPQTFDRVRAVVIAGGLAYTVYLVYLQVAVLNEFCALCMISAGIVTLIAALQAYLFFGGGKAQRTIRTTDNARMKEFKLIGAMALVVAVLAVADIAYFRTAEPARAATAEGVRPGTVGAPASAQQVAPAACGFDESRPAIENYEAILSVTDPMAGNPDASVTFIEFFDPNCPHCKTQHEVTKMLVEDFGDRVRFFFKAVPLWQFSVSQIEALYAAAQEGKFEEMLGGQFDRQRQGGLGMSDLREIAANIGMDPDLLEQRIERGIYRNATMEQRQIASDVGLTGVPAVFINGQMVQGRSRTYACLTELLEDASS